MRRNALRLPGYFTLGGDVMKALNVAEAAAITLTAVVSPAAQGALMSGQGRMALT